MDTVFVCQEGFSEERQPGFVLGQARGEPCSSAEHPLEDREGWGCALGHALPATAFPGSCCSRPPLAGLLYKDISEQREVVREKILLSGLEP